MIDYMSLLSYSLGPHAAFKAAKWLSKSIIFRPSLAVNIQRNTTVLNQRSKATRKTNRFHLLLRSTTRCENPVLNSKHDRAFANIWRFPINIQANNCWLNVKRSASGTWQTAQESCIINYTQQGVNKTERKTTSTSTNCSQPQWVQIVLL